MNTPCSENCDCDKCTGAYEGEWYGFPPLRNATIAAGIAILGFILGLFGVIPELAVNLFFVVAILLGAYHWAREGFEEIIYEHVIDIEMLMIASTLGAIVLGLIGEAVTLVVLYAAAEGVEHITYARTRASIRKLLDLAPKEAVLLRNGAEQVIPAEQLRAGDIFLVKPGAGIPTDGIIMKGRSNMNEAAVTGESVPVEKLEGMKVFAATLNIDGALLVQATAAFNDNSLAKMIHLVEEAQEQKGKTQLFIEWFGRRYTPIVLLVSLIIIVVPPFFGIPFNDLAIRGVVLLVAAAPCALIMSTPVAVAAGIGSAGKHGILIKGGAHLENLGKTRAIAFDKTGTLTTGTPAVTDIIPLNGDKLAILRIAYTVERHSDHPLARAIVNHAEMSGIQPHEAVSECALPGQAASATINGTEYFVGKPEFFTQVHPDEKSGLHISQLRLKGKTVMFVGTQDKILGIIAVRDQVRPNAKAMNKTAAIDALTEKYGVVAMVGDGINDAPALARATVGIAMGTIGTDAAIEAADVALMADDLAKVPEAIEFGRKAVRIGNQNIVFSLAVLAIPIPTALAGILGVTAAVIFHEASELLAVGNGLRVIKR
ncbi:MAG: heavy metal translocating P-type ATPase [Methanomicrobiales archaeon]|nr:heavy metal translocating P-type ATPase [Methanomicrobiales archaeon]